MLIQTTHTEGRRDKREKNKSIILESLKEATLNKKNMSRTRNLITIARGTIAENARRQLSLMNQCRMPYPRKNDFRFMGHRI
jgi:hypothetical protein